MKHLHERTGLTFDIGSVKDTDGKIDANTRESLMRLACNFEEE